MIRTKIMSIAFAAAAVAAMAQPAVADAGTDEAAYFTASLSGANEVSQAGDKDGQALVFLSVQGNKVSFAARFRGIRTPTTGGIHQGAKGTSGDVKIPLFTKRLHGGRTSATGTVLVEDQQVLDGLRTNPANFYIDLGNREFPAGAVRGQVHKLTSAIDINTVLRRSVQASVRQGVQIYACTKQSDGTFAFTQDNVRADLARGISHFFAKPGPAGPPEWLAHDRSAVTGAVLARTPNGAGNIAELDIAATQVGRSHGLLAGVDEILRLNTVGGVAPAGPCDPAVQPRAEVNYHADYVFVDAVGKP
jgi:hypothetical protein